MNMLLGLRIGDVPWHLFLMRVLWIGLQLALVYLLGNQGERFFYQGF